MQSGDIDAKMFGEPLRVEISALPVEGEGAPEVLLNVRSKLNRSGLNHLLGNGLADYFQGEAPWVFSMRFAGKSSRVAMNMNLRRIGTSLPYPLDKTVGAPLSLTLDSVATDLGPALHGVDVRLANRAGGRLLYQRRAAGGWSLLRGRLDVGGDSLPAPDGTGLHPFSAGPGAGCR